MASTKRLLKERAQLARNPVPYITFQEDDEDDDADMGGGDTNSSGIFEWKFILELNPTHDDLEDADTIGRAADSPYCTVPAAAAATSAGASSGSPKKGGILSRATRSSKANNNNSDASETTADSSSTTSTSQSAHVAFQLKFPPNYPFKPPSITVLTKSYHPNINTKTGEICDAVLTGEGWGPTLNVRKVCARLRKFLCDPDPDHPLESEIAQKLVDKPKDYANAAFMFATANLTKKAAFAAMQQKKK